MFYAPPPTTPAPHTPTVNVLKVRRTGLAADIIILFKNK